MTKEEFVRNESWILKVIRDRSVAEKDYLNVLIEVLEQEPCDDAISREAVKNTMFMVQRTAFISDNEFHRTMDLLMCLPSVKPQLKTGRWIEKDGFDGDVYYDCSECGESWTTIEGTPWDNEFKYCPSCGARMVEPQESEDKE